MMRKRSCEPEFLDLGPSYYSEEEYQDCLKKFGQVGRLLGGNRASLKTFNQLPKPHSILDVGCGGGQFTIELAKQYPEAKVLGVDVSPDAIAFAKHELTKTDISNLKFEKSTPELSYPPNSFDIVTATLVCHHMTDDQLIEFLKNSCRIAKTNVIINDLHRHWLAYFGFACIAGPLFRNRLIYHDGLVSIKRAFKRKDWIAFLEAAGIPLDQCSITWHWAFRWILCIEIKR